MTALLRFKKVALHRGGRILFEDLDLKVGPGDALQITGPNGSGKSSLLRLAANLLRAERGQIERPQAAALADDHIALDRDLTLKRALQFWEPSVDTAMDDLGLKALAQVPVRLLSSGELKRATLARVAASSAPLWLLDEPLNALDTDGAERLVKILDAHRARGGAILAASHQALSGGWRHLELGA